MPIPPNPIISSLTPNSGIAGTHVTIAGLNLLGTFVTFNGVTAHILSQTNTSMIVVAPTSTTGPVEAFSGTLHSGTLPFTYLTASAPTIASLSPSSGPTGTSVVITGTNFQASQGASTVTFNGAAATIISWGSTSITAVVPPTATTGNVVVTVAGLASNSLVFTVTTPSNGGTSQPLSLFLIPSQDVDNNPVIWTLDPTNFDDPALGGFYNWKVEDVIAGRTPTISCIIISYRNLGIATFTLTLTGTNDNGDTVTNATPVTVGTVGATGRIASKVVGLALTAQNIQASISRAPGSGPLSITKIRLEGRVELTVLA